MIQKTGSPEKVKLVVISKSEFEDNYNEIVAENKLALCPNCNKILSKIGSHGLATLQHRGQRSIISTDTQLQCICGTTVQFKK